MSRAVRTSSVELRPEASRGALADLVGPAELAVLPLEPLHPLALLAGQADPLPAVDLGLADPEPKWLRPDPELPGDRGDGAMAITPLGRRLGDQADGSLSELGWVATLRRMRVCWRCSAMTPSSSRR